MSFCIISRVLLCVCFFVHVAFVRIKLMMMMIVHCNLKPHKFFWNFVKNVPWKSLHLVCRVFEHTP